MALRKEVLTLYRRILRLSKSWEATNAAETVTERSYIKQEARDLFRKNKQHDSAPTSYQYKAESPIYHRISEKVQSAEEIRQHIKEAEARIEIAIHYQNPFPRLSNIPQQILPLTGRKLKKGQSRALKQSTPIYLKSLYETENKSDK